ncbi:hypothetical protein P9112_012233 [Eukaryota sp. TZLM1-RC]
MSILLFLLFLVNAVTIVNEERFMRKVNLGYHQLLQGSPSLKRHLGLLFYSYRRVIEIPLVFVNAISLFLLVLRS